MKRLFAAILLCACCMWTLAPKSWAALLTPRSDTLSTSAISTPADHDIIFYNTADIPPSGKIIFTPESGSFSIPAGMYYRDVDLLINGVNQKLAATPGIGAGSPHGVTITSGTAGNVIITLNNAIHITPGSIVEIKIGQNANFEAAGLLSITNAATTGSHIVSVATTDSANTTLDNGDIGLSMTVPVGISATSPSNTASTPDISPAGGTFVGSTSISIGTTTPGASIYYTTDGSNPSTSSLLYSGAFTISQNTTVKAFAVKSGLFDSGTATAIFAITQPNQNGGGGGGGSIAPYLPPTYIPPVGSTRISGQTGGFVMGQCDNGAHITLQILPGSWSGDGIIMLSCLPWSTFLPKTGAPNEQALADTIFGISATDADGRPLTTSQKPITATISYTSGQRSAFTEPFVSFSYQPDSFWKRLDNITSSPNLEGFSVPIQRLGPITLFGQSKPSQCQDRPADLNCDGKVNVTDLSILLYYWNSRTPGIKADINKDGIVNLIDFSILLYWWTN